MSTHITLTFSASPAPRKLPTRVDAEIARPRREEEGKERGKKSKKKNDVSEEKEKRRAKEEKIADTKHATRINGNRSRTWEKKGREVIPSKTRK